MLRRLARDIHWPLVFSAASLVALGTMFIYSANLHDSGDYINKQFFWLTVAGFAMMIIPLIGYRTFLSVSYLFYTIAMIMLVLVLVMGQTRLGAQRWINLGPIALQPSEFAKIATVLALANFLGSNHPWERRGRTVLSAILFVGVPFLLIVKQPDLGSALMFVPLGFVLLFLWGIRYRILVIAGTLGVIAAPLAWGFLKEYQKKRILVFLDPNRDPLGAGYTAVQSRIAVGSGGLFGKGYLEGTQSQLQFVPEHHTDFIFCVLGEELGFAGGMLLLFLYFSFFKAAFHVMENTTDIKAKLLIAGILSVLFTQMFINISMTFGLMPITGITLPFVSYGGSSLVATAIAVGLVLSVHKERSIF